MNDFTASNGIAIRTKDGDLDYKRPDPYGWLGLCGGEVVDALREFFQAEADERLGRWRWPETPDYVAIPRERTDTPREKRRVRVIHEPSGDFMDTVEGSSLVGVFKDAARAFFHAHPERKPWGDAKPGEVWILDLPAGPCAAVVRMGKGLCDYEGNKLHLRPEDTGRRIWPEVSS